MTEGIVGTTATSSTSATDTTDTGGIIFANNNKKEEREEEETTITSSSSNNSRNNNSNKIVLPSTLSSSSSPNNTAATPSPSPPPTMPPSSFATATTIRSSSTRTIPQQQQQQQQQQQRAAAASSKSKYPLTAGLSLLLQQATTSTTTSNTSGVVVHNNNNNNKESPSDALQAILQNSMTALDTWYFTTPPTERAALQAHRTCLRISTTATSPGQGRQRRGSSSSSSNMSSSITITDLGVGLTKADLINVVGIGKYKNNINSNNNKSSRNGGRQQQTQLRQRRRRRRASRSESTSGSGTTTTSSTSSNEEDEDDIDTSSGSDDNDDVDDDESVEETTTSTTATTTTLQCTAKDLGGFYAAICALAVGVKVGTKAKFDDYYEFELGHTPNNNNTNNKCSGDKDDDDHSATTTDNAWKEFTITRPMDEGQIPSLATGYTNLADVRGPSGTSVTLYLQDAFQEWTTPDGVRDTLLPMLTKLLETTPYTFMVEGVASPQEIEALLQASEQEEVTIANLQKEASMVAVAELEDDPAAATTTTTTDDAGGDNALDAAIEKNAKRRKTVLERAKYIPLRLSLGERKLLRLVEAAMTTCDYTTLVDLPFKSRTKRIHQQIKGVLSLLRGLVTACDYTAGQKLALNDDDPAAYSKYLDFLRDILEIARRHKIMNPEKMRTEYGKLVYLMQDAVRLEHDGLMEWGSSGGSDDETHDGRQSDEDEDSHHGPSLIAPIRTVYRFLEERNALGLLRDPSIEIATEEILATPGKSRAMIDNQIRRKELAVSQLKRKYHSAHLGMEDIHLCLYSICDNNSFLNSNRVPIDKAIDFLKNNFSPNTHRTGSSNEFSLAIVQGEEGARLDHSHERQYYFALQSLTLWRDIIDDMFRLWAMAEMDLLSPSISYKLEDTGQGMQRVQQSPETYKAMTVILAEVQRTVQQWIGSSVIHMGDHNVPNALTFIDKYTQVPRILGPIVTCLENLEKIVEKDQGIESMITHGFGGLQRLRREILHDFFRSAFDGSGGDNFQEAGSCVDGRMTSAWNWCSDLPNKPFYPIFKLTGFVGFDGEFK